MAWPIKPTPRLDAKSTKLFWEKVTVRARPAKKINNTMIDRIMDDAKEHSKCQQ